MHKWGRRVYLNLSRDLQNDWAVVFEYLKDFSFSILIVGLSFETESADTLSVVYSWGFMFTREATVVLLVMIESDHYLPFGLVFGDTPVSWTSVAVISMFGVLSELLASSAEDDLVVRAVFKFLHEHELIKSLPWVVCFFPLSWKHLVQSLSFAVLASQRQKSWWWWSCLQLARMRGHNSF